MGRLFPKLRPAAILAALLLAPAGAAVGGDYRLEWTYTFSGGPKSYQTSVSVNPAGEVYAVGASSTPGNTNSFTLITRHAEDGTPIWQKLEDHVPNDGPSPKDYGWGVLAMREGGLSVVDASGTLYRFDSDGNLDWSRPLDIVLSGVGRQIAEDKHGNIWVAGYSTTCTGCANQCAVDRFTRDGDHIGMVRTAIPGKARSLAVNSADEAFLAIQRDDLAPAYWWVVKLNPSLAPQWQRQLGAGSNTACAVACDNSGSVWAAGMASWGGPEYIKRIVKYEAGGGNVMWSRSFGWTNSKEARDLAIDGEGFAWAVGTENVTGIPRPAVWKFDPAGEVAWSTVFVDAGTNNDGTCVAVNRNGAVYVGGGRTGATTDALLLKYSVNPLDSQVTVAPAPLLVGKWATVSMSVAYSGTATATGVAPELSGLTGGPLELISGPDPAGPLSILAGSSTVFTWTLSASGTGVASFTCSASGTDDATGLPATALAGAHVTVMTPAALTGYLAVFPNQLSTGDSFLVTLTVTNIGGEAVSGLALSPVTVSGAGAATKTAGPTPPVPSSLGGGSALTFTWTYTASAGGSAALTVTASGLGSISGGAVASGAVNGIFYVTPLRGALAVSATSLVPGQWIEYALTVTNTGTLSVTGVLPALEENSAVLSNLSSPSPAGPLDLATGVSQTFRWTATVSAAGTVRVTVTATGVDTSTASPTAVTASLSVPCIVPATLVSGITFSTTRIVEGQWFLVRLAVTNTGADSVADVRPVLDVSGISATVVSGPLPADPVTLTAGGKTTFVWTLSACGQGITAFSGNVSGTGFLDGLTKSSSSSAPVGITGRGTLTGAAATGGNRVFTGDTITISARIANDGGTRIDGLSPYLFFTQGGSLVTAVSGANPGDIFDLPAARDRTVTWTFRAAGAGTVAFTVTASGLENVTIATRLYSAAGTFEILDLGDVLRSNLPPKGRIQVRNNVIRPEAGTVAYIVVNAKSAGDATFTLYSKAGVALSRIGAGPVKLDADGWGYAEFDGRVDGKPLASGVYWIVASGAVSDRRPVVVRNKAGAP